MSLLAHSQSKQFREDLFDLWAKIEEVKEEAKRVELQDSLCFSPEVREDWEIFFQSLIRAQDSIL